MAVTRCAVRPGRRRKRGGLFSWSWWGVGWFSASRGFAAWPLRGAAPPLTAEFSKSRLLAMPPSWQGGAGGAQAIGVCAGCVLGAGLPAGRGVDDAREQLPVFLVAVAAELRVAVRAECGVDRRPSPHRSGGAAPPAGSRLPRGPCGPTGSWRRPALPAPARASRPARPARPGSAASASTIVASSATSWWSRMVLALEFVEFGVDLARAFAQPLEQVLVFLRVVQRQREGLHIAHDGAHQRRVGGACRHCAPRPAHASRHAAPRPASGARRG